ncbi:hypothetical protein MGN70_009000 [Eutypa lata]|nr:hypothetical protein MGN70_009000 [Eutypa lata]
MLACLFSAVLVSANESSQEQEHNSDTDHIIQKAVFGAIAAIIVLALVGYVMYYILLEGYYNAFPGLRKRECTKV